MIDASIPLKGFLPNFVDDFSKITNNAAQYQQMQIQKQQQAEQEDERRTMGSLFAGGMPTDPAARQQTIGQIGAHNPQLAFKLQQHFQQMDEASAKREGEKWKAATPVLAQLKNVPAQQRSAYLHAALPALQSAGWAPQEIDGVDLSDQSIDALAHTGYTVEQVLDSQKTHWVPIGENGLAAFDSMGQPTGSGNPFAPGAQGGAAPQKMGDVFGALIQQESGGRPGVTGPQTPYGRAQGMTQMLPSTAHAMADKLHMPWNPDMMTGTTPEAASYQQTLGRAYYDEGLQKYGGDPEKALMYYHGGPSEKMWGPKTHAYAGNVMDRAQGGQRAPRETELRVRAAAAIKAGKDPAMVNARLNQLLQGGQ